MLLAKNKLNTIKALITKPLMTYILTMTNAF